MPKRCCQQSQRRLKKRSTRTAHGDARGHTRANSIKMIAISNELTKDRKIPCGKNDQTGVMCQARGIRSETSGSGKSRSPIGGESSNSFTYASSRAILFLLVVEWVPTALERSHVFRTPSNGRPGLFAFSAESNVLQASGKRVLLSH